VVRVVGDTNFDGMTLAPLTSCWVGHKRDEAAGTLGRRTVDYVFAAATPPTSRPCPPAPTTTPSWPSTAARSLAHAADTDVAAGIHHHEVAITRTSDSARVVFVNGAGSSFVVLKKGS
jgi:hypothetical protein